MDKHAFQTELDRVGYTQAGQEALTDALMRGGTARRSMSWVKRGIAAAAAAAVLAGSALAVSGPLWSRFFGEVDEDQQAVIDTLSQNLPAAQSNGTVMTPLEAFGDEDFYYLLLEITPPEGVVLPNYGQNDSHYQPGPESSISISVGVGGPDSENEGSYQFMNPETGEYMTLLDGEGNNIRRNWDYHWEPRTDENSPLIAVIRLWGEGSVNFADGTDKILHIPGLWVQSPDKIYTPVLTGSWDFNIGTHSGGIESLTPDVTGVTVEDEDCGTMTMEYLRLSPLGMRIRHSWSEPREGIYPGAELSVVMEDGSEVFLSGSVGSCGENWNEEYGPFETPIDLSKAVAVRWGTALLSLKGK